MQVIKAHAGNKSNMQVYLPLNTGTLWHPHGINHRNINLSTHYNYYHAFH